MEIISRAINEQVFPGAVVLVSKEGDIPIFEAYGEANIFSKSKMVKNTIFDMASLTKPIATTVSIMKLVQIGKLDINDRIENILNEFKSTEKDNITVKNLLNHTSGLPAHRPYYLNLLNIPFNKRKEKLKEFILKEPLINEIGKLSLYSDIGFMLLQWIIEEISMIPLDKFVKEAIYSPLGIFDLFYQRFNENLNIDSDNKNLNFAATEFCPLRNIIMDGLVHDENAYSIGGVAGHSGIFGTASDLHKLLLEILSCYHGKTSKVFDKKIIHEFLSKDFKFERTLGFDVPSKSGSSSGKYFFPKTVGHLGFTGTSFWMDLERSIIIILLTNRVHPSRDNNKIKAFRPIFHDYIMEFLSMKTR
ncbi:MAG: serine hydrolase [Desulfobacterales bacterium]|nr:serine hydrolase [Desulfobacterales bacterium]